MKRYSGNRGLVEQIPDVSAPSFVNTGAIPEIIPASGYEAPGNLQSSAPRSSSPLGGLFGGKSPLSGLLGGKSPLGGVLGGKSPLGGILDGGSSGGLGGFFSKLTLEKLELEDYLLIGVLYLLYRESGDIEFLVMAGAMFIL